VIDPARVRRPQDKPRVERTVPFVRNSFFAGETFIDLTDGQRRAVAWCTTRRNSKFSRSKARIRSRSSVVVPGRRPVSTSDRFTQFRNVSGCIPNWPAIGLNPPTVTPQASRHSATKRIARSRNSSGCLFGRPMISILPSKTGDSTEPGAIQFR
jgi:hypothetical protein